MYKIINRKKLYATMAADLAGGLLYYPLSLFRKTEEITPEKVKDILIIRTAYIGDVVMTLPLLKPIKERFGGARVTFLTSKPAGELLTNNPYVDEVITYDPFWFYPSSSKKAYFEFIKKLKRRPFDLVIETRGDIREFLLLVRPLDARFKVSYDVGGGGYLLTHVVPYNGLKHKVQYHLDMAKFLGCKMQGEVEWGIYLTDKEKERAAAALGQLGLAGNDPFVAIHPGGRKMALKCWPLERYAAVADFISNEFGLPVIITGSPGEVGLANKIKDAMTTTPLILAGKTTLRELAGIVTKARLVVANDSSPMHIAAAMKTPVVAVFGPSKSAETAPYGPGHIVVEKDFPCRLTCDEDICKFKVHNQCMKDIHVDDVAMAVKKTLTQWEKDHGYANIH